MNLNNLEILFWDFDGVIKESVSVKTDAFEELFKPYGKIISNKVKYHHTANGGMSRFEKIPLYLKWANIEPTSKKVKEVCSQFGSIVRDRVINSKWVPGVRDFIENYNTKKISIIVSATPQDELDEICFALDLNKFFSNIFGSPVSKSNAIKDSIDFYGISSNKCLMFGDAQTDIDAARENNINFIFRLHDHNKNLNIDSDIKTIKDFRNISNLFQKKKWI